jgi:hypothetical protein
MAVLQSMPSPVEIAASMALVDATVSGCPGAQSVLAGSILLLTYCDCHVPDSVPYHYKLCRVLSAICMHAFCPASTTLICLAFADPTFGKRAQASATKESAGSSSRDGASEHVRTATEGSMSLDDVIALLKGMHEIDKRAEEILAAAITVRDSTGRDRKQSLRNMATVWNVARYENRKDRPVSDLTEDIKAAVCSAAFTWKTNPQARGAAEHANTSPPEGSGRTGISPTPRNSEDAVVKKARVSRPADHTITPAKHAGGTVHKLPESPQDVMSLRRVGSDMFEATQRSGKTWSGDATLLSTLPHGQAKLATIKTKS